MLWFLYALIQGVILSTIPIGLSDYCGIPTRLVSLRYTANPIVTIGALTALAVYVPIFGLNLDILSGLNKLEFAPTLGTFCPGNSARYFDVPEKPCGPAGFVNWFKVFMSADPAVQADYTGSPLVPLLRSWVMMNTLIWSTVWSSWQASAAREKQESVTQTSDVPLACPRGLHD